MNIDSLAAIGLLLASVCIGIYLRRNRSPEGQGFSCQIGEQVFTGHFEVSDGQVRVIYDGRTLSAPLGNKQPMAVAERLLAQMQSER